MTREEAFREAFIQVFIHVGRVRDRSKRAVTPYRLDVPRSA